MINPAQIPDEVVEAAARALCKEQRMFWPDLNNDEHNIIRGEARAAIAAALNAWPGMHVHETRRSWLGGFSERELMLPLPQQDSDE